MNTRTIERPAVHTDSHELGRRAGLDQAAAHLRGEVERLRVLQRREWDGFRERLIVRLQHLARSVETLR